MGAKALIVGCLAIGYFIFGVHSVSLAAHVESLSVEYIDSSQEWYSPDEPHKPLCNLRISGPIEDGDLDKIRARLEKIRPSKESLGVVCLQSPGGSYEEGLRISKYFLDFGVGTLVDAHAECFSACAIAFMAGTLIHEGARYPSRRLHASATLGFHAPYIVDDNLELKGQAVRQLFADGIAALSSLMALEPGPGHGEFFNKELLVQMASKGPSQSYLIDTIGKAVRYRISLVGLQAPPASYMRELVCNVCNHLNSSLDPVFDLCAANNKIAEQNTNGMRELQMPVRVMVDRDATCTVTVSRRVNTRLFRDFPLFHASIDWPKYFAKPVDPSFVYRPSVSIRHVADRTMR